MQILPRETFEKILSVKLNIMNNKNKKFNFKDFPKENDYFRKMAKKKIDDFGIFKNPRVFSLIAVHSSKSIGKNYETIYTADNIWIKSVYGYNCGKLCQALKFISK